MNAIGRRRWAIPEGYIPSESKFSDRALVSHETACILNAGDHDAAVKLIRQRSGQIGKISPERGMQPDQQRKHGNAQQV